MKMQLTATLIGVVGKKGEGNLDNGQAWKTDRVELHVLSDFPTTDAMAHGKTVTVHQIEGFNQNHQGAIAFLDQEIILDMELIPAKKLGSPPKMVCTAFRPSSMLNRPSVNKQAG